MTEKVKRGQPLNATSYPATHFNDAVDVARAFKSNQLSARPGRPNAVGVETIFNNSGVALPRYGIVGLENVYFNATANLAEFENRPILVGQLPASKYRTRVAVTQEPIAAGAFGRAVTSGTTVARVTFASPWFDACSMVAGDVDNFSSEELGAIQVLWSPRSGGTHLSFVRLPTQTNVQQFAVLSMTQEVRQDLGSVGLPFEKVAFDTVDLEDNMTANLPFDAFQFDQAGVYNVGFQCSISHDSSNSGREIYVNVNGVGAHGNVPFFTGRNAEGTNMSFAVPVVVPAIEVGLNYWIEIGGTSDSYLNVFVEAAMVNVTSVAIT